MDKADVVGSIDKSVAKVEDDTVEVDVSRDGIVDKVVVEDVLLESSFLLLMTSGIDIPAAAKSRIPINSGISSFFFLWKTPFPSDISLKDVNRSFFEWL